MPLSDHEQRILAEIERRLLEEASASSTTSPSVSPAS
jgi:hypothetical protein